MNQSPFRAIWHQEREISKWQHNKLKICLLRRQSAPRKMEDVILEQELPNLHTLGHN